MKRILLMLVTAIALGSFAIAGPPPVQNDPDDGGSEFGAMAQKSGLHYRIAGDGPPLLLLHGFTGAGVWWDPFVEKFAERYTTIVPDLPGHGRSKQGPDPYRFDHVATDILALMDELGVDRFRAIGYSAGAVVLTHMAIQEPERIVSMVLDSPSALRERSMLLSFPHFGSHSPRQQRYWHDIHPGGQPQVTRLINSVRNLADYVEEVYIPPERLSGIQARTLIVLGDRDPWLPVDLAEEMYQAIPNAALWIIPSMGHNSIWADWGGSAHAASIFPAVATQYLGTRRLNPRQ